MQPIQELISANFTETNLRLDNVLETLVKINENLAEINKTLAEIHDL